MGFYLRLLALCGGVLALSACVSTPQDRYARAYDSCDREVGACYADCRVLEGEDRREACQQRCTNSVNRCFAQVRQEAELYSRARVRQDFVFYGRNGLWSPFDGYRFGRHGRRYSFNGYRYDRFGFDRWGYDRFGYDRFGRDFHGFRRRPSGAIVGRGAITRNGTQAGPRIPRTGGTADAPRRPGGDGNSRVPNDGRFQTEDGSVFTADGERLRYGGRTEGRERSRSNGVRATGRSSDPTVKPSAPTQPASQPRTPRTQPQSKPSRPRASKPEAAPRQRRAQPSRSQRSQPRRPRTAPRSIQRGERGKQQAD